MHTTDSPALGRARGAHSPSHGETKDLNTQQLADQDILGNIRRRLFNAQSGAGAWEVFTLSVHYEVQTADQKWIFAEKWQAVIQQVKIANALAAKEDANHAS